MFIKLTVCDIYETDQIKDPFLKTKWHEWKEKEQYFNINYIKCFKECHHISQYIKENTLGIEPFNTLLWQLDNEECYRIKETTKQIINLINKVKK